MGGGAEGEVAWKGHLLVEGHVRVAPVAHPGDLHASAGPSLDIAPCHCGVEVRAMVAGQLLGFRHKRRSVEVADGILAIAADQNPLHMGEVAIDRELEEVRAFEAVWNG